MKPSILDYFHMEVSNADRFAGILTQMTKDEADWPFEIAEGIPRDPAGLAAYLGGQVAAPEAEEAAVEPEPLAEGTVTWPDESISDAANLPEPPPPDGGEGNSTVVGGSTL